MSKGYSGMFIGTAGSFQAIPGEAVFRTPYKSSSNDYRFFDYIAQRKDIDPNGTIDIVAHGANNGIQMRVKDKVELVSARYLSRILAHNSKYGKKQPIRLLSCNTGSSDSGFAQNLANKLNTIVYAPTDIVWVYPGGKYIVAPRSKNDRNMPDKSRLGRFKPFYPGGNRK